MMYGFYDVSWYSISIVRSYVYDLYSLSHYMILWILWSQFQFFEMRASDLGSRLLYIQKRYDIVTFSLKDKFAPHFGFYIKTSTRHHDGENNKRVRHRRLLHLQVYRQWRYTYCTDEEARAGLLIARRCSQSSTFAQKIWMRTTCQIVVVVFYQ